MLRSALEGLLTMSTTFTIHAYTQEYAEALRGGGEHLPDGTIKANQTMHPFENRPIHPAEMEEIRRLEEQYKTRVDHRTRVSEDRGSGCFIL
jgi:hypothetical protein